MVKQLYKWLVILLLAFTLPVFAAVVANPVVQYKMNDNAASSVVVDAMGTIDGASRTDGGEINTDTIDTAGKINGALQFNGSTQYVSIPDNAVFDITDTLTVCVWAKNDATNIGQQAMVGKDDAGTGKREWSILLDADQKLFVVISDDGTAQSVPIADNDVVTETGTEIDEWHLYGFTIDTSGGAATPLLYLDGISIARTEAGAATTTINNDDVPVTIGGVLSNGLIIDLWDGAIDNVLIFDRVLTSDEITTLWNNGNGTEGFGEVSGRRGRYSGKPEYRSWHRSRYR